MMNSFNFCLSEKLFVLQFWIITLLGSIFSVVSFFFSALCIYHATSFWHTEFLLKKSSDSLMGVYVTICFPLAVFKILLYKTICFYLAALKILSLILDIFIIICIGLNLLRFILFGDLCASWTWIPLSFPRLGKFSAIISSNRFSAPFSLSFLLLRTL